MKLIQILEHNVQPEAVIMVGLPGSGKSTIIRNKYPDHVVISSDNIIERHAQSEGKTYDEVFKEYIGPATTQMWVDFKEAVSSGKNIVWDQTNLSRKKRRGILSQLPNNYKKVAVVFEIDENERQRRADSRLGKTIPAHVMRSMMDNYQTPTMNEGFNEIVMIKE